MPPIPPSRQLYDRLSQDPRYKGIGNSYESFVSYFSQPTNAQKLYGTLSKDTRYKGVGKDFNSFSTYFQLGHTGNNDNPAPAPQQQATVAPPVQTNSNKRIEGEFQTGDIFSDPKDNSPYQIQNGKKVYLRSLDNAASLSAMFPKQKPVSDATHLPQNRTLENDAAIQKFDAGVKDAVTSIAKARLKSQGKAATPKAITEEIDNTKADLKSGKLSVNRGDDGKVTLGTSAGFWDGVVQSVANSVHNLKFAPAIIAAHINGDNKGLADIAEEIAKEKEYIKNHPYKALGNLLSATPVSASDLAVNANTANDEGEKQLSYNSSMGSLGQTTGSAIANLAPLLIPGAGEAEAGTNALLQQLAANTPRMIAGGVQTGLNTMPERFLANYQENKTNGLTPEQAATKAAKDAEIQSIIPAVAGGAFFSGTFGGGAATKGLGEALGHAVKNGANFAGLMGVQAGVEGAVKQAGGYKTDYANEIGEAMKSGFAQTLGMELLPHAVKLPSYVRSQLYNYASENVAKPVLEQQLSGTPDGEQILNHIEAFKKLKESLPANIAMSEETKAAIAGKLLQKAQLKKQIDQLHDYGGAFNDHIAGLEKQMEGIDNDVSQMAKTDKPFLHETDEATGERLHPVKTYDQLKADEKGGIVVPKEYGGVDTKESGEGEDKIFTGHPYTIEKDGALEKKKYFEAEGKTFKDKKKAEDYAQQRLAQHYYENGMHDGLKPIAKETKIKEDEKADNSTNTESNERQPTEEEGSAITGLNQEVQPTEEAKQEVSVNKVERNGSFAHTKGVFKDSDGNLYKSTQEANGSPTNEHSILEKLQKFDNVVKIGDKVNTNEGEAFKMEKLTPLKEGDKITLEDYRKIQDVANELDRQGIFMGEHPDIGLDKEGKVKLYDFSLGREKAEQEHDDPNYDTRNTFKALKKFLNKDDKQVIDYEETAAHNKEFPEFETKEKGYLYNLKYRPFGVGTFPKEGFVHLTEKSKSKDGHYGTMEYSRPLSSAEIKKFELENAGRSENKYTPQVKEVANEPQPVQADTTPTAAVESPLPTETTLPKGQVPESGVQDSAETTGLGDAKDGTPVLDDKGITQLHSDLGDKAFSEVDKNKMPFDEFKDKAMDMAVNMKDSGFDWRFNWTEISQKEREKGVADIKAGKDTAAARKVSQRIQDMYDNGTITVNRGRGNNAETATFTFEHWFGSPSEQIKAAESLPDLATTIAKSEGITADNIEQFKHLFDGFPYEPSDYEAVKAHLAGQDGRTEPTTPSSEQGKGSTGQTTPDATESKPQEPPSEPPVEPTDNTSSGGVGIKHAATAQLREKYGLDKYKRSNSTDAELEAAANEAISNGYPIHTLIESMENGTPPTGVENFILKKYVASLDAQMEKNPTDALLAEIDRVLKASDKIGSDQSEAFRTRKGLITPDDTMAGFFIRTKDANGGAPLTEEQKATTEQQYRDISEAQKAYEEKVTALEAENARLKAEKEVSKNKSNNSNSKKSSTKKTHEDYVKERQELVRKMKEDLLKIAKGAEGFKSDIPFLSQLKAADKYVTQIVKSLVDEGVTKLADVVKEVHEQLKDVVQGITEKDVHDLIAGEYREKKQTRNELSAKMKDLRDEAALLNKLERLVKGEQPKTEKAKVQRNQQIHELQQRIKSYQQEVKDAGKFYGESDTAEKRIQALEDELQRLKERREKEPTEETKREISKREQSLREDIEAEKDLWNKEKAHDKRMEELNEKLSLLKKRTTKPKDAKQSKSIVVDAEEKKVMDAIDAEKEKWAAEKDAARQASKDYQKIETERNRQIEKVKELEQKIKDAIFGGKPSAKKAAVPDVPEIEGLKQQLKEVKAAYAKNKNEAGADYKKLEAERNRQLERIQGLKDKIDSLQQNGLPAANKKVAKEDTPEIEQLKKEKSDLEKSIRQNLAHEKKMQALETELQRLKDRKAKVAKTPAAKVLTQREQILRDAIEAERKAWKDSLRKTPEEIALKSLKTRNENESKKIEEQIRTGNFDTPAKKPAILENKSLQQQFPQLYKEALAAKDKLIKLRQERDLWIYRQEYSRRSTGAKILDGLGEVLNVPRTLMSSMDYSAPLRQGFWASIANPTIAAKAFIEMFRMGANKARFDRWFEDIKESPAFDIADKSGLYLADPHTPKITAREEQFMSQLAEKIPIVGRGFEVKGVKVGEFKIAGKKVGNFDLIGGSERAYVGYLNKLRWDLFNSYVDRLLADGKTIENSPEVYKSMAAYVNDATGRGNITNKTFEQAAPLLNSLFFSPRLIASRLNLLTKLANPMFYKAPKEMQVMYIKDFVKVVGVGLATMALAKYGMGADVEDDPRSSDFGKIKSGNTRIDVWGGFLPYIRYTTQILSGEVKNQDGTVQELGNKAAFGRTRSDVFMQLIRGKLAPLPGAAIDLLQGKDVVGQPATIQSELGRNLMPLIKSDFQEAYQDAGVAGVMKVLPSLFGVGVSTYQQRPATTSGSTTGRTTERTTSRSTGRSTGRSH